MTASRPSGAWTARRPGNATSTAGCCNTTCSGAMRPLRNQTPGERAKVNPPFKEWADVVKAGAASRRKVKAEARPVSQPKPKSPQPEAAPAPEAKGRKPAKGNRTRGRKKAKAKKAVPAHDTQAGVPQGVRESAEAEDGAAMGAPPAPAAQQDLGFGASGLAACAHLRERDYGPTAKSKRNPLEAHRSHTCVSQLAHRSMRQNSIMPLYA